MIGESFEVLRKDKKLVLFPILSGLSTLAVAAMYILPLFNMGVLEQYKAYRTVDPTVYAWLFLWYCTNYFVIIFFNCALAACAQIRFAGGQPTLRDGLSQAGWKIPSILMWAVVASTVGVALHAIEERSSWRAGQDRHVSHRYRVGDGDLPDRPGSDFRGRWRVWVHPEIERIVARYLGRTDYQRFQFRTTVADSIDPRIHAWAGWISFVSPLRIRDCGAIFSPAERCDECRARDLYGGAVSLRDRRRSAYGFL